MKITVDRIENGVIVCLTNDERSFGFRAEDIGFSVSEGDVLDISFTLDEETGTNRKNSIRAMFERLKNKEND